RGARRPRAHEHVRAHPAGRLPGRRRARILRGPAAGHPDRPAGRPPRPLRDHRRPRGLGQRNHGRLQPAPHRRGPLPARRDGRPRGRRHEPAEGEAVSTPNVFTLPAPWRSPDADAAAGREERVEFADLAGALGRLAEELAVEPVAVAAAAHLKVLSMLTEERAVGLEIVRPAGEAGDVLRVSLDACPTWRDVVIEAHRALLAAPVAASEVELAQPWGRVVLVTRPLAEPLSGFEHDLVVSVGADAIVLSSRDGSSLGAGTLRRLAEMY